ncbi:MAG: hypothetical protein M1839_005860 [Geoglossum umbratile]|nr:MAG: hypothetical protein M1839_005860 [Geoglossum umbratile]
MAATYMREETLNYPQAQGCSGPEALEHADRDVLPEGNKRRGPDRLEQAPAKMSIGAVPEPAPNLRARCLVPDAPRYPPGASLPTHITDSALSVGGSDKVLQGVAHDKAAVTESSFRWANDRTKVRPSYGTVAQ